MQKEKHVIQFDLKERIITDQRLIDKYDRETNYNFYIPPHELTSLDYNKIKNHDFTKARDNLGKELSPIYIAINEEDEFRDSKNSPVRIHKRVWQGKHRYKDTESLNQRWSYVYVYFRSFEEFIKTRPYESEVKDVDVLGNSIRAKQTSDDIKSMAEKLWKVDGVIPKSSICSKLYGIIGSGNPYSNMTIRRHCPQEYKDEKKMRMQGQGKKQPKKSKKDIEIDRLSREVTSLIEQTDRLKMSAKPESEKDSIIKDLEISKKKLQLEKTRLLIDISKTLCNKCRKPVKEHDRNDDLIHTNSHGYAINEICGYV